MKDQQEVVKEFNELVNMTASELEKWLKSDDSQSAGWPKEGANGESVGHDSGVKIVEILKSNPKKDPEKYTDEQVQHMRKVVSYCKRHLAQEEKANDAKSPEEVKKTKSYASLMNWGHDVLKKRGAGGGDAPEQDEENADSEEVDETQTGQKRKAASKTSGASKKRETRKGKSAAKGDEKGDDGDEEEEDAEDEDVEVEDVEDDDAEDDDAEEQDAEEQDAKDRQKANGKKGKGGKANGSSKPDGGEEDDAADEDDGGDETTKGPKKGDTVSWNWGSGHPQGKVLDVKGEKTTIETKRGNEVTRKGEPDDPAVVLDAHGSKTLKLSHELN